MAARRSIRRVHTLVCHHQLTAQRNTARCRIHSRCTASQQSTCEHARGRTTRSSCHGALLLSRCASSREFGWEKLSRERWCRTSGWEPCEQQPTNRMQRGNETESNEPSGATVSKHRPAEAGYVRQTLCLLSSCLTGLTTIHHPPCRQLLSGARAMISSAACQQCLAHLTFMETAAMLTGVGDGAWGASHAVPLTRPRSGAAFRGRIASIHEYPMDYHSMQLQMGARALLSIRCPDGAVTFPILGSRPFTQTLAARLSCVGATSGRDDLGPERGSHAAAPGRRECSRTVANRSHGNGAPA
jgi:hypothetical protein